MLGGFRKTEIRKSLDGHPKKLKSYKIKEEDIVSNNILNIMRTVIAEALMNHSVYQPFLTNAKQALKLCVQYLIDHLRIYTPILVALSTIDPVLYQNLTEETVSFMRQLPRYINVLNTDERTSAAIPDQVP